MKKKKKKMSVSVPELRRCVKVEVAVLIVLKDMVCADVKPTQKMSMFQSSGVV